MNSSIYTIDTMPLNQKQLVASYLIKGSEGTALIDPGFPSSVEAVTTQIADLGVDPEKIDYIVLTHSHIDHAGSAGKLAHIAKKAKVAAHKRGAFYLTHSIKIGGGAKTVFGELSEALGMPEDIEEDRIKTVAEGDSISLGDMNLTVYYTPGHSGDHISLFEKTTGSLFTGDTACLQYPQLGSALLPAGSPPIYRADYIIEELKRFSRLDIKTILTPHFGKAPGSPASFLEENINTVKKSRDKIDKMFKDGMEFPQVAERIRKDLIIRSGKDPAAIPAFLADEWLPIMIKTGLMGFMADILQYARDIRPFY